METRKLLKHKVGRSDEKLKRALLVIDVQNEYFTGKLPVTYPPGSLEQVIKVIEAARLKQIPVVFMLQL